MHVHSIDEFQYEHFGYHALTATVVTGEPMPARTLKQKLTSLPGLSHETIEVERCTGHGM